MHKDANKEQINKSYYLLNINKRLVFIHSIK
jgi:hypothetical protein